MNNVAITCVGHSRGDERDDLGESGSGGEFSDASKAGARPEDSRSRGDQRLTGLETHSRELEQLTKDPRWTVLTFPEYAKHSAAFVRSVQALHTAAAQRDLEKAPNAYVAVTLQCVECHRYLARARIAQ